MNILQNHYEGTELDDSKHYTIHNPHDNKVMNICAGHQQMSFIAELRNNLPVETGCRLWIAPRRGCVHAYMPVYYGINDFPPSFRYYDDISRVNEMHFSVPEDMYNRENGLAWWSFIEVTEYVDENYGEKIEDRRDYRNKLQQEYFEMAEEFDNEIRNQWQKDKTKALHDISLFNNIIFKKALESNSRYLMGR